MYRENVKRTWAQPICTPSLKQNGGERGRRAKKGVPALSKSVCVRARVSSASTLFWIGVRTGWGQWQPIEKQKRKGPVSDTLMNRSSLDFSPSFCAFTSRGPRSTPSLPGLQHYQRRRLYLLQTFTFFSPIFLPEKKMMSPQKVQLNYKNMASKKGNGCVLSFKLMLKFKPLMI